MCYIGQTEVTVTGYINVDVYCLAGSLSTVVDPVLYISLAI